jgi:hypothetical protein
MILEGVRNCWGDAEIRKKNKSTYIKFLQHAKTATSVPLTANAGIMEHSPASVDRVLNAIP